jgi:phosphonate dehydrogenase
VTTPPHIVVTNRIHDDVAARLSAVGTVDVNTGVEPWSQEEMARRLARAGAMMGFMTDCVNARLLARAPQLRIVACALKGFDSYDVAACTERGIWLSIVPDLLTEPTAELAVGLAIGLGRHVRAADANVRRGAFAGWRPTFYGTGLAGSTVAIIGLGRVGSAIATRLSGFGCRLVGVDPAATPLQGVEQMEFLPALAEADFVIVALPLTPATRHLVSRAALAAAKPGSLWINVGRGSVVDEDAMADALHAGAIGGYAADVFAFEDWRLSDRPRTIPEQLLAHPATLFTPHLGSAVRVVRHAIETRAADNILDVLDGRPPRDAINRPMGV